MEGQQQEAPKSLGEAPKSLGEVPKSLGEAPKSLSDASNGARRKTEDGKNMAPTSLGALSNDDSRSVEGTPKQRKTSIFGSENFLAKLEIKIKENQIAHDELVKTKFETVKADIKEYFNRVTEQVHRQIADTRDAILDKIEMIIENEAGYLDWDSFKEELIKKKEDYEKAADITAQKQAFDSYFEFYNNMNVKIDAMNNKSYAKLDSTSKIFKFDEIVLDKFIINFQSLCSVLESDFVTSVSFVTGHLDPTKMRLDELVQIPHQGVSCTPERLDQFDTFVLGGRDGRVSMYDAKSLRVLDVIQGLNEIVNCLLYIPQHNILLIGGSEPKIIARRVEGRNLGKHLSHLDAGGSVTFLVFMEDQNLIASVGADPNIRLYNPNSLVMVSKIPTTKKGSSPKGGACYFKDKKVLAVGFDDGTLQFYSMKTKQMVFGLFTESKSYSGLMFNEPSGRLIAHTQPGLIKIWTFKGDRPADESDINLEGEGDKACNIQMAGRYLVSASNNEKVVVYDMEEMKPVKKIDVPGFKVQGLLVLEKEGKIIASDENNAKIACIRLH